jgi:hypothetical protein
MSEQEVKPRSLKEIMAAMASAADTTPSTVIAAFVPDRVAAAGLALPPLTIETWLFLEKIKSPFARNEPNAQPSFQQMMEAFYVIVMPPAGVDEVLGLGEESFRQAVGIFARTIPMRELPAISTAIASHIVAEFAPRAEMGRPGNDGDGDSPLPESLPATGPAASLPCSTRS